MYKEILMMKYKEILINNKLVNQKKTTDLFKEFLKKIENLLKRLQEILIKVDKAEIKRKRLIY
jgi:hypothetical protein